MCSGHLDLFVNRCADRTADGNRCAPSLFPSYLCCGGTQIGALRVTAVPLCALHVRPTWSGLSLAFPSPMHTRWYDTSARPVCWTFDSHFLAGEVSSIAVGPWQWSCTANCAGSTCSLSAGTAGPIARTLVRVTVECSADPCLLRGSDPLRCSEMASVLNGTLPASIGNLACRSKITSMCTLLFKEPAAVVVPASSMPCLNVPSGSASLLQT